jgi:hypothetical protein
MLRDILNAARLLSPEDALNAICLSIILGCLGVSLGALPVTLPV